MKTIDIKELASQVNQFIECKGIRADGKIIDGAKINDATWLKNVTTNLDKFDFNLGDKIYGLTLENTLKMARIMPFKKMFGEGVKSARKEAWDYIIDKKPDGFYLENGKVVYCGVRFDKQKWDEYTWIVGATANVDKFDFYFEEAGLGGILTKKRIRENLGDVKLFGENAKLDGPSGFNYVRDNIVPQFHRLFINMEN